MKKTTIAVLGFSHGVVALIGFAAGIYLLPILIAPPSPTDSEIEVASSMARYSAEFVRDLEGSDRLHWGEGRVSITDEAIVLAGELAPGPDYRLYLSPEFVETEAQFEQLKDSMIQVGDVRTFENFRVNVPTDINVGDFNTVVVWCETFGEFITAARYQ